MVTVIARRKISRPVRIVPPFRQVRPVRMLALSRLAFPPNTALCASPPRRHVLPLRFAQQPVTLPRLARHHRTYACASSQLTHTTGCRSVCSIPGLRQLRPERSTHSQSLVPVRGSPRSSKNCPSSGLFREQSGQTHLASPRTRPPRTAQQSLPASAGLHRRIAPPF